MHVVSILVRYGFWWHSEKPYRLSRIRVPSKLISHENGWHMHFLAQNTYQLKKEKLMFNITNTRCDPRSVIWRQVRTVLSIETWSWSERNMFIYSHVSIIYIYIYLYKQSCFVNPIFNNPVYYSLDLISRKIITKWTQNLMSKFLCKFINNPVDSLICIIIWGTESVRNS